MEQLSCSSKFQCRFSDGAGIPTKVSLSSEPACSALGIFPQCSQLSSTFTYDESTKWGRLSTQIHLSTQGKAKGMNKVVFEPQTDPFKATLSWVPLPICPQTRCNNRSSYSSSSVTKFCILGLNPPMELLGLPRVIPCTLLFASKAYSMIIIEM